MLRNSLRIGVIYEPPNVSLDRHAINVATMTLVVFFDDRAVGAWAYDRMHTLAVKHPSRVLILDGTRFEGEQRIATDCGEHDDCPKTRREWVELGVKGSTPEMLASVVSMLSLPQAPVVLVWLAAGITNDPRFAELAQNMQTVVYNSSVLDHDAKALHEFIVFGNMHPEVPIADLSYLRLGTWQSCIATFFDAKDVIEDLFDLRRVEITCGSDPEAYYLLGWLAGRLEWEPCAPNAFCNRFGTQIDFTINRKGLPRRIRRVALASSQSQFVAEVDGPAAEAIALTVSGAKRHDVRYRPITGMDIASLVERAILTARDDRVFRDSLAVTGEILKRRMS